MTIHEIEERTGMTRANIRYYERAGLLAPERADNNYRDYSDADLAALQKVQLLRQLRVPVGEIARLRSGELELGGVLMEQSEKLRGESDELGEAAVLCQALLDAQASYDDLDAARWLHQTETGKPRRWQPLTLDVLPTAPLLWKRFLARAFDLTLLSTIMTILRMLVLRWPFAWEWWIVWRYYGWLGMPDWVAMWINLLAAFAALAVLEPLLLCTAGTTPGKWLFGLRVRTPEGEKLTYRQGLKRIWSVFARGVGFTIPFYRLWRLWKSYRTAEKGKPLPWESDSCCESGQRRLCGLWFILANAACLGAIFLAFSQAILPLHRGGLTVSELVENCNMYLWQFCGQRSRIYLTEEGRWVDKRGLYSRYSAVSWSDYQFETDERGIVTAVRVEYEDELEPDESFSVPNDIEVLYFAYVMANNHVTPQELLRLRYWVFLARGLPSLTEDFETTVGDIRITNRFSYSGYENVTLPNGETLLCAVEGEPQRSYWSLLLERIDGEGAAPDRG